MNINYNKNANDRETKLKKDIEKNWRDMERCMIEFCQNLARFADDDSKRMELFFDLARYIKNFDRILYSPISNVIYHFFQDCDVQKASQKTSNMITSIHGVLFLANDKEDSEIIDTLNRMLDEKELTESKFTEKMYMMRKRHF